MPRQIYRPSPRRSCVNIACIKPIGSTVFTAFGPAEILSPATDGMLDLEIDPKLAWALKHREWFPMDVNTATREQLMRIPGLGAITVGRLIAARRQTRLRLGDMAKLTKSIKKVMPFIETLDWTPGGLTDAENLRARFAPEPQQLALL